MKITDMENTTTSRKLMKISDTQTESDEEIVLLALLNQNWPSAMDIFFGKKVSSKNKQFIEDLSKIRARVVADVNPTDNEVALDADMISMIAMLFTIIHRDARVIVVSADINPVKDAIWPHMTANFERFKANHPIMASRFELTDKAFYRKIRRPQWRMYCKGYTKGNEQTLAGEMSDKMLTIVVNPKSLTESAFNIIKGSQIGKDNRMLLVEGIAVKERYDDSFVTVNY
jgi:hypothetical protein